MIRFSRYQPERQLLGGISTHQSKAPFHGARDSNYGDSPWWRRPASSSQPDKWCHGVALDPQMFPAPATVARTVPASRAATATGNATESAKRGSDNDGRAESENAN